MYSRDLGIDRRRKALESTTPKSCQCLTIELRQDACGWPSDYWMELLVLVAAVVVHTPIDCQAAHDGVLGVLVA